MSGSLPIWIVLQWGAAGLASLLALIVAPVLRPELQFWAVFVGAPLLLGWAGATTTRRWAARAREQLGPRPPDPGPSPQRPAELDPPTLTLPSFVPPRPLLPSRPAQRLPGQWERCNVCFRPLTDPTSRWRGIGPDCYRQKGVYWPEGPINPAFRAWELDVERIREDFEPVIAEARSRHDAQLQAIRARHAKAMAAWESRLEGRKVIETEYLAAYASWVRDGEVRRRQQTSWDADPRQRALKAAFIVQRLLPWGALTGVIGGVWLGLP